MARNNEEMEILGQKKVSEQQAGYMELPGAIKDASCEIVDVKGGVSSKLGCCNLFEHEKSAEKLFSCGTCEYVRAKEKNGEE